MKNHFHSGAQSAKLSTASPRFRAGIGSGISATSKNTKNLSLKEEPK